MDFPLSAVEPAKPIIIDGEKCVGCCKCVNVCPIDLFIPPPGKGMPPEAAYPDECWYCGCCVMECPCKAIELRHPLMNRVRFVRKDALRSAERKL